MTRREKGIEPLQVERDLVEKDEEKQVGLRGLGASLEERHDRGRRSEGVQPEELLADVGIQRGVEVVDLDRVERRRSQESRVVRLGVSGGDESAGRAQE